jgi:hypothetical protein
MNDTNNKKVKTPVLTKAEVLKVKVYFDKYDGDVKSIKTDVEYKKIADELGVCTFGKIRSLKKSYVEGRIKDDGTVDKVKRATPEAVKPTNIEDALVIIGKLNDEVTDLKKILNERRKELEVEKATVATIAKAIRASADGDNIINAVIDAEVEAHMKVEEDKKRAEATKKFGLKS